MLVLLFVACGAPAPTVSDAGADLGTDPGTDAGALDAPADAPVDARVAPPPTPGDVFVGPALLSETGLYADLASGMLADGVMPYAVRFELWADGAEKQRWLQLPPGTQIDTHDPDRWVFPIGTTAWKEFRVGGVRVETRYLHKVAAYRWENVAYVWRADGSDADARPDGVVDAVGSHDVPDIAGCYDCHRGAPDGLNGVGAIQLATGAPDELLTRLETAGLLTAPITPRPAIPGTDLDQAALGYLAANCAHCHNDDHPLAHFVALRMTIPLGLTDVRNTPTVRTVVGAMTHHTIDGTTVAIVAGDPTLSQAYRRMLHRGDMLEMPPRGTEVVDTAGADLVRRWIETLPR